MIAVRRLRPNFTIILLALSSVVVTSSSSGASGPISGLPSSSPSLPSSAAYRRQEYSLLGREDVIFPEPDLMASVEIEESRHRRMKRDESTASPPVHDTRDDAVTKKDIESHEKVALLHTQGGAAVATKKSGSNAGDIEVTIGGVTLSTKPLTDLVPQLKTIIPHLKTWLPEMKTLSYFALWFALNIYYNIVNKQVLMVFPLPVTVATVQLGVGSLYVLGCWLSGLRIKPEPSPAGLKALWPIAWYHGSGQLFTVLSLGAAAVSFTHIVKAMEPFFSALVAAVAFKQIFKPQVYASLIPVVVGVSIACATDVSFSWLAFLTAMASNLAFALRANFSKSSMSIFKKEDNKTMSPANVYGVVTVQAFLILLPLVFIWEGTSLESSWAIATSYTGGPSSKQLAWKVFLSGLFHYLNNEVMYLALDNVHPITLAVGNTAKRVFIIIASLLVFRNPISLTGAFGSTVGILGVLVYSLTKQHYDALAAKQQTK